MVAGRPLRLEYHRDQQWHRVSMSAHSGKHFLPPFNHPFPHHQTQTVSNPHPFLQQGPLVRDLWKSAWPSSTGGSKSGGGPSYGKGSSAIVTIGGTGGRKNKNSGPRSGLGSHWDRIGESGPDSEPAHSRDDLELVPKAAAGRVKVTVHASPVPAAATPGPGRRRGSDEEDLERNAGGAGGGARTPTPPSDDDDVDGFPRSGIRQRTDVEWRVERRSLSAR